VNVPVPPEPMTVTTDVPPLHNIDVLVDEATKGVGASILTVVVDGQPLSSVTV
jgi:hypothetical protein